MVVWRRNIEKVYSVIFGGIFVWWRMQLFSYVGLYENVDVDI